MNLKVKAEGEPGTTGRTWWLRDGVMPGLGAPLSSAHQSRRAVLLPPSTATENGYTSGSELAPEALGVFRL